MMQPTSKKSKYVPEVRMVRGQPGCYLVTSERWTYVMYETNVPANTCSCEAGQHGRPTCKHRRIAAEVFAFHTSHKAQPTTNGAAGLMELYS